MHKYLYSKCLALLIGSLWILTGCVSNLATSQAKDYIKLAEVSQGIAKQSYFLRAANQYVLIRDPRKAQQILNRMCENCLPSDLIIKKQLLQANIFLLENRFDEALGILNNLEASRDSLSAVDRAALDQLLIYAREQKTGVVPGYPAESSANLQGGYSGGSIALLLPLHGSVSGEANAIKNGFFAAYYQAKEQNANAPGIQVYDTSRGNVAAIYQQAVAEGARWVVGPLTKAEVSQLAHSTRFSVPTLTLNTLPEFQNRALPNFYQFALSPNDEAQQLATKAWSNHHSRALIIAPANAWGQSLAGVVKNQWQQQGGQIVGEMDYTNQQSLSPGISRLLQIDRGAEERSNRMRHLYNKRTNFVPTPRTDADVIFLIAKPAVARQIRPLLKFYYAGHIPVYATSMIYTGNPNPNNDRDLDGIHFCDMPWVLTPNNLPGNLNEIQQRVKTLWPSSYYRDAKLYAFGVDAYTIIPHLSRINGTPGATGTLYLQPNGSIYRKLGWATMVDGMPSQTP